MSFQREVTTWILDCFGKAVMEDKPERTHRFVEESLELAQACGCSREEVLQMVDYVYSRPVGEVEQEVGGTLITLAGLCSAHSVDMHDAGEVELTRVWSKIEQIRAKHQSKPLHSPLPGKTWTNEKQPS